MPQNTLDYPGLIDNAMRGVVKDTLKQVKLYGLPGDHHFYISFRTDFPGVKISETLKSRYPQEITIVMQHQYWDLKVEESFFSVMLSFNNVPEKLVVPYAALTAFADPSVKFGLQFHAEWHDEDFEASEEQAQDISRAPHPLEFEDEKDTDDGEPVRAEIIALDAFRKK